MPDPRAAGGGNETALVHYVTIERTMASKWLELLKELAPRVARVAMLFNPATAPYAQSWLNPFKAAAASFAVQAIVASVQSTSEVESVVAAQAHEPNGGLIVMPDTFHALFIPRRLAICIAQALSQDHFAERNSMAWAAS